MTHSHCQDQEILTLPHCHSALLNPIEHMWTFCKNYMYVAVNNTRQTISMVRKSLQWGSVDSTLGLSPKRYTATWNKTRQDLPNQETCIGPFFRDVMTGVALSVSYFVRPYCWLYLAHAGRGWLLVCFTTNVWLNTSHFLHYRSSSCSQMVWQRHLADQPKVIGGNQGWGRL